MNTSKRFALALLCAIVPLSASAGTSKVPVTANDVVGRWRSDNDAKKIVTITRDGASLALQTPQYSDWEKWQISGNNISRVSFQRNATGDDIRAAKRIKGSDPLPDDVVSNAAGKVIEKFSGSVNRESHWVTKECDLTMKATWTGFIVDWQPPQDSLSVKAATKDESFKQIRYEWPDLKRSIVQVHYDGSSMTFSDLYEYFHDRIAVQVLGEFGAAIFKSIYKGVTGAVPAETLLGKFATSLLGKAGEQAIKGDSFGGKDLAEVIAGQVLDKVLEGESDEPFQTFSDAVKGYVSDTASDKSAAAGATQISKATADSLESYLQNQCRYQLIKLEPSGNVAGGVIVVDTQSGNATVWVTTKAHGSEPAHVLMGTTGGLPEEDTHYASLDFRFSLVQ